MSTSEVAAATALLSASRLIAGQVEGPASTDALRGVLDALRAAQVLVPGVDGRPATGAGLAGREVVWAFTDEEAYQTWLGRRGAEGVSGWGVAWVGGGRRDLGADLARAGATHLAVNPAGPGSITFPADTYRRGSGQGLLRRAALAEPGSEPLAAPGVRGDARQEVATLLGAAEAALGSDLFPAVSEQAWTAARGLGDRHSEVAVAELRARQAIDGPDAPSVQINGLLHLATWWGEIGETDRAASALADGGRRLIAALDGGDANPWLRQAVALVAGNLPPLGRPEHDDVAVAAQEAASRYPRTA